MKIINEIDKEEFFSFAFNNNRHGKTIKFECYEYLLTMELYELTKLCQKYEKQVIDASDFSNEVMNYYKNFT